MTPAQREKLAQSLANNSLLPALIDERRSEIFEAWESCEDQIKRDALWHQLKATNDLKDFLYGRLSELAGRGD